MYTYKTKIKLHETDAAGLLFFSNQFKLVHDAYEALLKEIGFGFSTLIRDKDYFLPIVHAEADFKKPLFVDEMVTITVKLEKIGTTSFIFVYALTNEKSETVGTAQTVHVTMDKKSNQKIEIPKDMRQALSDFLEKSA